MDSRELQRATRAGVEFLLASQMHDGCWSDWQLPPGASRPWTTAYVGYRLSAVGAPWRERVRPALGRAGRWLAGHAYPQGGWGYDAAVGPDADSTALAIVFLTSQGRRVSSRTYARLRAFQRADGGFSTFAAEQGYGAWSVSHPDVTGTAIAALLTRYAWTEPCVQCAAAYARAQATSGGLWHSYWWNTPLYATEANLRWLVRCGDLPAAAASRATLVQKRAANPFEAALLALSLLHVGVALDDPAVAESLALLLEQQWSDGSWPSGPTLRLPPRDSFQPWTAAADPGRLFSDEKRTFTSVTVVAALCAAAASGPVASANTGR